MPDTEKTPSGRTPLDTLTERRWPHLIVLHGTGVGEVHRVLDGEATVGRDPSADICIHHPTVSRRHARVTVVGDGVFIQDLGSTNGTMVGLQTVRGRRLIPDGAVVALGHVTMLKMTYSAVLEDILRRADNKRATTGGATRVASLDYLRDQLQVECAYARRHRTPLTLVTFRGDDIPAGAGKDVLDDVMGMLAITIYEAARDEDILARSTRDTFVVLLRADEEQGARMAERVRGEALRAVAGAGGASKSYGLTCAVTQLGSTALAMPAEVIDSAAEALGRAAVVARDGVIRLPRLESTAFVPKGSR